jgi:hypothetical protein
MIDDREPTQPEAYNPIEFIEPALFTKESIKREALKVLAAENAILKAATAARNIGNASVSLEPEMKAIAGGLAFVAKDVGNLISDVLILVSKVIDVSRQTSSQRPPPEPEHGS